MKEKQCQSKSAAEASPWQKTSFANLIRYEPSGTYFARLKVGGKLIRRSLKTEVLTVAKLKLADLEKRERGKLETTERVAGGKATFKDLLAEYRQNLANDVEIKPRTRTYREECIARILKSWPGVESLDVRKITEKQCADWAGKFKDECKGASTFNNTVGTLRLILEIAVKNGGRYTNPVVGIGRRTPPKKDMELPTDEQLHELLAAIRAVPYGPGLAAAELGEFLAYGGFRINEAANVLWEDCLLDKGQIIVRGDPETGTKGGEIRRVPMIADMRQLLERLRANRPDAKPTDTVMRVRECQGSITRACKAAKIRRFTHHDLRHLFATRCIECGTDIPTVALWLGHKDFGVLALKTYAQVRDKHSDRMAANVTFAPKQPENVVKLNAAA